ncbi:MAG: hypothetical protein KKH52_04160 [Nanoarchaeota archaeon]|nr:hypothetical protein [Nanoarchaeota archaeon]
MTNVGIRDSKKENNEYGIEDVISFYDFVLVDTSFLHKTETGRYSCITEELYDVRTQEQLAPLKEYLQQAQMIINWHLQKVISQSKVHTINEIVAEMGRFGDILEEKLGWVQNPQRKEQVGKCYQSKSRSRNWRRANKKISRTSQEFEIDDVNLQEGRQALAYLNSLFCNVREMKNSIKIYKGLREPLPRTIPNVSEPDYNLAEALFGYVKTNPRKKVAIFSDDRNISIILGEHLAKNFLENNIPEVNVFHHVSPFTVKKVSPLEFYLYKCKTCYS